MKKPFKNPIAPRERKSTANFAAPSYEQATTGDFLHAGDNYGMGFTNPSGKEKVSGPASGPIPQKAFCSDPDECI